MKKKIECIILIILIVIVISVDIVVINKYKKKNTIKDKDEDKTSEVIKEPEKVIEKPFITEYDIESITDEEVKTIFEEYHAFVASDSFGEGLSAYKVLNSENVAYARGRRVDNMYKDLDAIIEYNPKYLFLSYSANDLIKWNGDSLGFINAYKESISLIKEKLPDTVIIINSVIKVTDNATVKKPGLKYYTEFNNALMNMAKEMDIDFLENNRFLTSDSDFGGDGVHPKRFYFYLWGRQMASYLINHNN